MAKQKIAIDICNTIADVNAAVERLTGIKPDVYPAPGLNQDWFTWHLEVFSMAPPIPYSRAALLFLAQIYDIVYVTARPEEASQITKEWLCTYGYPQGLVIHTNDKPFVFRAFDMQFAIDEAPAEIRRYHDAGIPYLTRATDYNTGCLNRFEWKCFPFVSRQKAGY